MPKLNILKHKSFHVWNKDNLEKVAKDEREDEKKQEDKRQRALEAQKEKRLEILRLKSKIKKGEAEGKDLERLKVWKLTILLPSFMRILLM